MPSPVGHSLAGIAVATILGSRLARRPWLSATAVILIANLPDVDFIPGLLAGSPSIVHRHATHSLAIAVLVGIAVASVSRARGGNFGRCLLSVAAIYGSHILLDSFATRQAGLNDGAQVFWPFSRDFFAIPLPLFLHIEHSAESAGFVRSLVTWHNLEALAREALIFLPFVCLAWMVRQWTSRSEMARWTQALDT